MKKYLTLILAALLTSCADNPAKEVTKEELLSLTKEWKEPKVVQWHYVGTHEGCDYFHYRDLGIEMGYKVKEEEIEVEERFDATADEEKWILMPWGPMNVN